MKLSIVERATALGILPREGSFDTLKALRKVKESLSLSEEEKQVIRWRVEYKCAACGNSIFSPAPILCGKCNTLMEATDQAQWETANDPNKDVFISPTILSIVVSSLTKMNEKGKLTEDLMPLYEKFVLKGSEEDGKEGKDNSK